jgi:hypothetical protein
MAQSTPRPTGSGSRAGATKRSASRSGSRNGGGAKTRAASAQRSTAARRPSTNRSRQSGKDGAASGAKDTVVSGAQSAKETVTSGAQSAAETVASGAKTAGGAIGSVAQKAKGPALAGGAALAGLAGGLVIAGRSGPKRVLGVPVPGTRRHLVKVTTPRRAPRSKDLLKVANQVGSAGRQAGELATEVRRVREQIQAGRNRSMAAAVVDGLLSRRSSS